MILLYPESMQNPKERKNESMELIPIKETRAENPDFLENPILQESLGMCIEFYTKVGFHPPWICYYLFDHGYPIASGAFKGPPVSGRVEIAYGTFEEFRSKGIGGKLCRMLVDLALHADPSVTITARTLPEKNHSTRILERNNFRLLGIVNDPDDGDVWEWEYTKPAI